MPLEEPVYRPPAEAGSVIIQVSRGCPHNRCLFCGMYKIVRYRVAGLDDVKAQIAEASAYEPDAMRAFLADGDALALPNERLEQVMAMLKEAFPKMARVSVYANGSSILAKSEEELSRLKDLGLSILYVGLESGDEELLRLVRKGETAAGMVEAARKAHSCGLKISAMALLGLGGRQLSAQHVAGTIGAINAMQPDLLSFLKLACFRQLPMYQGFNEQTEHGSMLELREIVAGLELGASVLRANHASVPFPIGGRLPKDKDKLLRELDRLLNSYMLDRNGPGPEPLAL